MLSNLLQETRHSFRTLGRNPGLTATVLLTIGLAVGANTTVFTLVNSLLLEHPSYIQAPDRLVRITNMNQRTRSGSFSLRDYRSYRDNSSVFSGFAARSSGTFSVAARGDGGTSALRLSVISSNYFDVLGVRMASGRTFRSDEDQVAGLHAVVIISDGLRERLFGDRSDVIGVTLPLNGSAFTVVGVVPPEYHGVSAIDNPADAWIPIMALPLVQPGTVLVEVDGPGIDNWLWGFARLNAGITLGQAVANMDAVAEQYYASHGATDFGVAVNGDYRFHPPQAAALRRTMRLLFLAAAMVLAVACANIASLLLARATVRRTELAVRSALGAGRRRIVQLLLTESVLLAWLGGVAGFGLALGTTRFAAVLLPLTPTVTPSPDWSVAAYAVALSTVAALVFGVVPAVAASRYDLASPLRASAGKGGRLVLRSVLVVSQAAVSLVLVTGAALFVQSARTALSIDLGFDVNTGAVAGVRLPANRYSDSQGKQFIRDALSRLSLHPDIEVAGVSYEAPLSGGGWGGSYVANDSPHPPAERQQAEFNAAGPGYFRAMGIPILEGRGFTDRDDFGPAVVVVNETLAREVWPNESPIGKSIARAPGGPPFTVVGLARDASYYSVDEDQHAFMYFSVMQQYYRSNFYIIARTDDPSAVLEPMRQQLRALDPDLLVALTTVAARVERQVGGYRVSAALAGLFAFVALLMTAVGLYGTIGYLTTRRAPEFAIRAALGARPGTVTGIVLGHGLKLVGVGVVLGATVSVGASRLLRGVLFEIDPGNPVALSISIVVLIGVAGFASYLPARRAGRVDPAVMLRVD
ncbi:MAG: ABC transporter permease [Gemmatimonadetes bacterium]|nr:ABC transporter permease [Gemmatimonadota bacterium]